MAFPSHAQLQYGSYSASSQAAATQLPSEFEKAFDCDQATERFDGAPPGLTERARAWRAYMVMGYWRCIGASFWRQQCGP